MDPAKVGKLIVARRVERGLKTREALAEATGLTARTLSDIEVGRRPSYSQSTLASVENALGMEPGSIQRMLDEGVDNERVEQTKPFKRFRRRPPGTPPADEVLIEGSGRDEPVDLASELATFEGLTANLHRLDPTVLAALLHRSGLDPEQRWRAVQQVRARAVEQLRGNWQHLAELIVAEGGTVDVETWPTWLEPPAMVEELRKDRP